MIQQGFQVEETHSKSSRTKNKAMNSLIPKIIFGVVFVGLLAALIAVSVLLSQKTTEFDDHLKKDNLTTVAPNTTAGPVTLKPDGSTNTPPVSVSGSTTTISTTIPTLEPIYRLPKTIKPLSYELFLQIHLPLYENEIIANPFTTKGSNIAITLMAVEENVNSIVLHARTKGSTPNSGSVWFNKENVTLIKEGTTEEVGIVNLQFEKVDIVIIQLSANLTRNQTYVLKIEFDGVIADDNQGLYRSSFDDNGKKKWLATSQFQPYKARRAFPCFDEPEFRSTFSITLKYPKAFTTVRSNGLAEADPVERDDWITTKFNRTPSMSTYLVAFLISDFSNVKKPVEDFDKKTYEISVIGNKALLDKKDGDFALDQGKLMMQHLATFFKQSYTEHLQKLDMVGVPDFNSGAMENWGLVLYRESSLMYRGKVSTADNKRGVSGIVGHELAHMIFGNLVTCNWWSDTWLNEGFARYMQYELMTVTKPAWKVDELFAYFVVREALRQDSYDTAHPLFDPSVKTLSDIDTMFDTVTYAKGASVLQMIKGVITKANFDSAVVNYVAKHKLSNTKHEDLLKNFDENAEGVNLTLHMENWIEKNGHPVLTLQRDYSGSNNISFKQQRFLLPVGAPDSASNVIMNTTWHIPLTMTHGYPTGPSTNPAALRKCWLTERSGSLRDKCNETEVNYPTQSGSVEDSRNYLIANVQQYGFYRVNYDETNWLRITKTLASVAKPVLNSDFEHERIDHITRGQLIDDSFNLARAGNFDVNYKIPLGLIGGFLAKETKYGPLASAMDNLRYVDQMLRGTNSYSAMRDFMQKLMLGGLYTANRWLNTWEDQNINSELPALENDPERTYDKVMANNIIIENACYYESKACLQDATAKFDQWRTSGVNFSDNLTPVKDPVLSKTIIQSKHLFLCYGIRNGNKDHWDYLFNLYSQPETTNSNKLSILRGLACSRDDFFIQRLLDMTVDNTMVRSQDISTVFSYISRFYVGELLAWNFVQAHWSKLSRRSNIIADIAGNFKDQTHLDQLLQLQARESNGKDFPEKPTFDKTAEIIRANIWWMKQNENIADLFRNQTITS